MGVPLDLLGYHITEGCTVVRAIAIGHSPMLKICKVTRVSDEGLVYLDNARNPIRITNRLVVITQDPLYRMVEEYEKEQK